MECLSILGIFTALKFMRLPEAAIALVKSAVSLSLKPLQKTAISQAESW